MRFSWLAILVALVAQQVLGFLWYSGPFFLQAWMTGIGKRPEDLKPEPWLFVLAAVAAILMAIGIAWILYKTHLRGVKAGALVGFGVGVLFAAPPVLVHEAFLGFPPMVLAIDGSKEIVGAIIVGAILGAWPRRNEA